MAVRTAFACLVVVPLPLLSSTCASTPARRQGIVALVTQRGLPTAPAANDVTEIYLERTACEGVCPSYLLVLRKTGHAVLLARLMTERAAGDYSGTLSRGRFDSLVALIVDRGFLTLRLPDSQLCLDVPETTVLLRTRQGFWGVHDTGCSSHVPAAFTQIARAIDSVGASIRWTR